MSTENDNTDETETEVLEESSKPESIEDTVRKAFEESSEKSEEVAENDGSQSTKTENEESQIQPTESEAGSDQAAEEDELEPPQDWTQTGKSWFEQLPDEAKREITKTSKQYQAHTTRLWQDLNRGIKDYGEIKTTIDTYLPRWGAVGVSSGQAIAQLAAAQDYIAKNPVDGIDRLLRTSGITPEQLIAYRNQASSANNFEQNNNSALTATINELQNWKQQQEQAGYEQMVNSISQEILSVQAEKDQSGRIKYPKLNDPQFLQRVEPLVTTLRKTNPAMTWGECTRRAYISLEGGSPSPQMSGLPQAATKQNVRTRPAATAAKSRGSVSGATMSARDVPKSIEDTLRLALTMNQRG